MIFTRLSQERGSALLGMIIVVGIIGLILWLQMGDHSDSTTGGSSPEQRKKKAEDRNRIQEKRVLSAAVQQYRADHGRYPSSLKTLVRKDYVSKSALKGPAGKPYKYDPQTGTVGKN